MLRSIKEMTGYTIEATDGHIGKVRDFLFNEWHWAIRYMVVDTGHWIPGSKVLVSPISLSSPAWNTKTFPVDLTMDQIEAQPKLDKHAPVSRQHEVLLTNHYKLPYYWSRSIMWDSTSMCGAALFATGELKDVAQKEIELEVAELKGDVLRSTNEVMRYTIHATNGDIGHVVDVIVDDQTWALRYFVVDTSTSIWLPDRKVLLSSKWIQYISWADRRVTIDHTLEQVKDSPHYNSSEPVNEVYDDVVPVPVHYTTRRHDHYSQQEIY